MINYEMCKGCKMHGRDLTFIDGRKGHLRKCVIKVPVLSSTEQCPCITCLVKGICSCGCEGYITYMRNEKVRQSHGA